MLVSLTKAAPRILGELMFGFGDIVSPSFPKAEIPFPLVLGAGRGRKGRKKCSVFSCPVWVVTTPLAKMG